MSFCKSASTQTDYCSNCDNFNATASGDEVLIETYTIGNNKKNKRNLFVL